MTKHIPLLAAEAFKELQNVTPIPRCYDLSASQDVEAAHVDLIPPELNTAKALLVENT